MDRWSSCIAYLICGYFIPDHVARQPATVWMASVQRTRKDQELIDKEATFYDVYNNMAEKFDQEMIKDWTESLTFLLVFAAIFAAVLTAFIVESKNLLQEDPQDVMVDVLISITNSLANGTYSPYVRTPFEVPTYAVVVNCLFFASISSSLFAALATVVALQWVGQYDSALDSGDPEKLALVRQYRFLGVQKWKMHEIIGTLPILLYISVFLFFAGLIEWMWVLHRVVGAIILAGASIALAFYLVTTIIAIADSGSPFRNRISTWVLNRRTWFLLTYIAIRDRPPYKRYSYLLPSIFRSAGEKEERSAQADEVRMEAVVWAAKRVNRSPRFNHRLLHIVKYANQLQIQSKRQMAQFKSAPWAKIFDSILETTMSDSLPAGVTSVQQIRTVMEYLSDPKWEADEYISYLYGDIKTFLSETPTDEEIGIFTRLYNWSKEPQNDFFFEMLQEFLGRKEGVVHSPKIMSYAINRFISIYWLQLEPFLAVEMIKIIGESLSAATPIVDTIRLIEFTCGTRAPRIDHLATLSNDDNILMMDVAIGFVPNKSMEINESHIYHPPKLVLEARIRRGVTIAIQVEDFVFEGKARVKLLLMDELPYVRLADVWFLEEPLIDFTLHSLGFTNIPGLKGFLIESIHSTLRYIMYDPCVLTVDVEHLVTGVPRSPPPIASIGALRVTIVSASVTEAKKRVKGSPNLYVALSINEREEGLPVQTSDKADTLTPVWNETKFLIPHSISNTLTLTILNHGARGKDKELGTVYWDLSNVLSDNSSTLDNVTGSIMSDGKIIGEITFQVSFLPVIQPPTNNEDMSDLNGQAGIVRIKVHRSKELDPSRSTYPDTLHSHLEVYEGDDRVGSTVVWKHTVHPIWNHTAEFVCLDQGTSIITFKVIDDTSSPKEALVGFCKIPLKDLLENSRKDREKREGRNRRTSSGAVGEARKAAEDEGKGVATGQDEKGDIGDGDHFDESDEYGVWYALAGCQSGMIMVSTEWASLDTEQTSKQPVIDSSKQEDDSTKHAITYDRVG